MSLPTRTKILEEFLTIIVDQLNPDIRQHRLNLSPVPRMRSACSFFTWSPWWLNQETAESRNLPVDHSYCSYSDLLLKSSFTSIITTDRYQSTALRSLNFTGSDRMLNGHACFGFFGLDIEPTKTSLLRADCCRLKTNTVTHSHIHGDTHIHTRRHRQTHTHNYA